MRDKAVDVLHAFDSQLSLLPGKLDKLITAIQASNSSTSSSQLTSQLTSQLREIAQEVKNLSETQKKVVKQQNKINERQQEINEQNKDCKAQKINVKGSIFMVPYLRNGEKKVLTSDWQEGIKSIEEGKGRPFHHTLEFTCTNASIAPKMETEKISCTKEGDSMPTYSAKYRSC